MKDKTKKNSILFWGIAIVFSVTGSLAVVAAMADPADGGLPPYGRFGYPGPPQVIQITGDGIGRVLNAMHSPEKRQQAAEKWLRTLEQFCGKSLEVQEEWIGVQKNYLAFQRKIEQLKIEKLKLQKEIEELKLRNQQLEKEIKEQHSKPTAKLTPKGRRLLNELGITTLADSTYNAYPNMSPEHFLIRLLSWRRLRDTLNDYNASKAKEEKILLEEVLGTALVYAQELKQSKEAELNKF